MKSRCGSTSQALRRQLSLRRRAKREGEGEEWVTDWHFQVSFPCEGEPREREKPAYGIELYLVAFKSDIISFVFGLLICLGSPASGDKQRTSALVLCESLMPWRLPKAERSSREVTLQPSRLRDVGRMSFAG